MDETNKKSRAELERSRQEVREAVDRANLAAKKVEDAAEIVQNMARELLEARNHAAAAEKELAGMKLKLRAPASGTEPTPQHGVQTPRHRVHWVDSTNSTGMAGDQDEEYEIVDLHDMVGPQVEPRKEYGRAMDTNRNPDDRMPSTTPSPPPKLDKGKGREGELQMVRTPTQNRESV